MRNKKKQMLVSRQIFLITFLAFLLLSGIHSGFVILAFEVDFSVILKILIPIMYWILVALGLTLLIKHQIIEGYEKPTRQLADAAKKVADGDFSVYVNTMHTVNNLDYFDELIINFNKMVEELGTVETLKTDFFSDVSHEIKTPLAVIQNNAELLDRGGLSEEGEKECIDAIKNSTKKLATLIENMLKLNKLDKQVITPVAEEYDLSAQIAECAVQFENVWEKKNIELNVQMEDERKITADEGLMELVWTNLLSNAFKFTEEGGRVSITEKAENGLVLVSVSDTGCGMTEETKRHIFDKFYQGDTSHSTEGTGLGLSLVHRILELSGCEIEVESSPGIGSVFTVKIPITAPAE